MGSRFLVLGGLVVAALARAQQAPAPTAPPVPDTSASETTAAPESALPAELQEQAGPNPQENRQAREALENLLRMQLFNAFKFTFEPVDADTAGQIGARVEPIEQTAYNKLLPANLLHFEALEGNVPIVFQHKNVILIDDDDKPISPLNDPAHPNERRYSIPMPLRIMRPCKYLKVQRGNQVALYRLCGHANDSGRFWWADRLGPSVTVDPRRIGYKPEFRR